MKKIDHLQRIWYKISAQTCYHLSSSFPEQTGVSRLGFGFVFSVRMLWLLSPSHVVSECGLEQLWWKNTLPWKGTV